MVVEKSVLMNVVFPNPDSPATYSLVSSSTQDASSNCQTNHNSKGRSPLRDDLVAVSLN